MSFFSNFQSDKCPGNVGNNPLNGLCEKVCIQVEKIFDACIKQNQLENFTLTLSSFTPADPAFPLTFISARSSATAGEITNLVVDRQPDKQCARVAGTVTIPMQVVYVDASGKEGTATSSISVPFDVLLFVPAPSVMPFNVTAIVSAVAPEGTVTAGGNAFTVNCCVTVILKVSMPVELLVPSYGYCAIPPAQEFSQEVCAGFFELPLYPQGKNCPCK